MPLMLWNRPKAAKMLIRLYEGMLQSASKEGVRIVSHSDHRDQRSDQKITEEMVQCRCGGMTVPLQGVVLLFLWRGECLLCGKHSRLCLSRRKAIATWNRKQAT